MHLDEFVLLTSTFARWLLRSPGMLDALLATETDPERKKELNRLKQVAQDYPYGESANAVAKLNDKVRELERDGMPKVSFDPLKRQVEDISAQLVVDEDDWLKDL